MNLITSSISQNMSILSKWVDSTPVPQMIDSVTYDVYESNNPFRKRFTEDEIENYGLRMAANTTASVGAEFFSVFANPYYLTHKITKIPTVYKTVVSAYKRSSEGG